MFARNCRNTFCSHQGQAVFVRDLWRMCGDGAWQPLSHWKSSQFPGQRNTFYNNEALQKLGILTSTQPHVCMNSLALFTVQTYFRNFTRPLNILRYFSLCGWILIALATQKEWETEHKNTAVRQLSYIRWRQPTLECSRFTVAETKSQVFGIAAMKDPAMCADKTLQRVNPSTFLKRSVVSSTCPTYWEGRCKSQG